MTKKIDNVVAVSFFVIVIVVLAIVGFCNMKKERENIKIVNKPKDLTIMQTGNMGNILYAAPNEDEKFYVYNYYKIPIDVYVDTLVENSKEPLRKLLISNVPAGKRKYTASTIADLILTPENEIFIYQSISAKDLMEQGYSGEDTPLGLLLGKAILHQDPTKAIRAIHAGLNVGKYDISIAAEPTKSPLGGNVLARLRIVNTSPRALRLYTVAEKGADLIIKPYESIMYFGQWTGNGIPLGVKFKDRDGILQDYELKYPITDLFMGLTSDREEPFYDAGQIGSEFDDTVAVPVHPLQINHIQFHKGVLIDRSFIPENW